MKFVLTSINKIITATILVALVSACVGNTGASGKRSKTIDFSVSDNTTTQGCGTSKYVTFNKTGDSYSCTEACDTGYHIATTSELNNFKDTEAEKLIAVLTASKGLCISDASSLRPTGEVYISTDYCSCVGGKADIINDCDNYCASVASTSTPTLRVNTTLGSIIANNTKLGSLYNWCNAQLDGDTTTPQCTLTAWDGTNTIENIPVTISKNSNSFIANDISALAYNTTYVVKLIEAKTGSNAVSTEFQIRRVKQGSVTDTGGTLKITPISQYTCLTYGGYIDPNGNAVRNNYARYYYYFPANESPAPIPPSGTSQNMVVCHDEISNPGVDNALYPRFELIPSQFTFWDKTEPRFVKTNNVMAINQTIQTRLAEEYSVSYNVDLFSLISYQNRPAVSVSGSATNTSVAQGFIMVPFISSTTGKAYCPTTTNYYGTEPLFKILKDYMGNTEGLYLGEKEAELIQDGSGYKTVYGMMFVTETVLKNFGFYIQNGLKVKATADLLHNKTIYYYWPVNSSMDPLQQGDRKLFTVRYSDQLNGASPSGVSTSIRPSDKRIGCVPVTQTSF
jgi:hypothetical protein